MTDTELQYLQRKLDLAESLRGQIRTFEEYAEKLADTKRTLHVVISQFTNNSLEIIPTDEEKAAIREMLAGRYRQQAEAARKGYQELHIKGDEQQ